MLLKTWFLSGLLVAGLCAAAEAPLIEPPLLEAVRVEGLRDGSVRSVLELAELALGAPLDAPAVWAARRRLLERGGFGEVELQLERGHRPGSVVLVIRVRERASVLLTADLTDLASGAVAVGAAYRPGGRRLVPSAELFLGEEVPGFALGLDAASVLGSDVSISARGYHRGREGLFGGEVLAPADTAAVDVPVETGVSFSRTGLSVELARPLGHGVPLVLALGHRLELLEGDNRNGEQAVGGEVQLLSAASVALLHGSVDHEWLPSRGGRARLRLTLSAAELGSDYRFGRLAAEAEQWLRLGERFVARVSVRGGLLSGSAPFSEHYFAEDLARGYESFAAAGTLGAPRAVGAGLELGHELPVRGRGRLRARVSVFADGGWLLNRADRGGGWQAESVASAGLALQVLTRFGAFGLGVPLLVLDVEPGAASSLPLPQRVLP